MSNINFNIESIKQELQDGLESVEAILKKAKSAHPNVNFSEVENLFSRLGGQIYRIGEMPGNDVSIDFYVSQALIDIANRDEQFGSTEEIVLYVFNTLADRQNIPPLLHEWIAMQKVSKKNDDVVPISIKAIDIYNIFKDRECVTMHSDELDDQIYMGSVGVLTYYNEDRDEYQYNQLCTLARVVEDKNVIAIHSSGHAMDQFEMMGVEYDEGIEVEGKSYLTSKMHSMFQDHSWIEEDELSEGLADVQRSTKTINFLKKYNYQSNNFGIRELKLTYQDFWAQAHNSLMHINNTFGKDMRDAYTTTYWLTFFGITPMVSNLLK